MAATVDGLRGGLFKLRISTDTGTTYKTVAALTDLNLDLSSSTRSIGSRDTCGWEANAPGLKSASVSGTALLNYFVVATALKTNDLFTLYKESTRFLWKITPIDCDGDPMADEYEYSGAGYVGNASIAFPDEETGTVDLEINVAGAVTQTIVA